MSENNGRLLRNLKVRQGSKNVLEDSSETRIWKLKEKSALVSALQQYGFGDLKAVSNEIKTRTPNEIRLFCEHRCKKLNSDPNGNKVINSNENLQNAPINVWFKKIKAAIEPKLRGKDYTLVPFMETMMEASKLETLVEPADSRPDFPRIYAYLSAILSGNVPPGLNPAESMVVLHLLNDLSKILISNDFFEEKDLLGNLSKRQLQDVKRERRINCLDHLPQHLTHLKRKLDEKEMTSNAGHSGSEPLNAGYDKYKKLHLKDYIGRQIVSSMNPLQVPLELLKNEYRLLRNF